MKRKKLMSIISLVLSTSLLLTACGQAGNNTAKKQDAKENKTQIIEAASPDKNPKTATNRKDTLIVGMQAPKGNFNPLTSTSISDQYVFSLIFDPLVTHNEKGEFIPNIGEWTVSKDGLKYTFKLKDGVKFSDGSPLTAEDVAFTVTATCDPSYDGQSIGMYDFIKGYEAYNKGNASSIEGIKIIDPHTIEFICNRIDASALNKFEIGILPKKYYGFQKGNFNKIKSLDQKPMGSGPYVLKSFKPGESLRLERFSGYWKGEPKIKNIILKKTDAATNIQELTSGGTDIDLVAAKPQNISLIKKAGFLDMQISPSLGYSYIGFNLGDPRFADKKVRQALDYGFNKEGFVKSYYQGYGFVSNQPFVPVQWAYNEDVNEYKYDPEKAAKLLDEAGWKVNEKDKFRYKDGKKFTINWLTYTGSKYEDALISILKENWAKIGVDLVPQALDFNTLTDKVDKREFEMYNMAWTLTPDPDSKQVFHSSQDVPGGSNYVKFHNAESDKLLDQGLVELDIKKRKEIYNKWAKLINEELPYIFVSGNMDMWVVNSRVKNLKVSSFIDWTMNISQAEIK